MKKIIFILCFVLMAGCNVTTNNSVKNEIIEENSVAPNIMVNNRLYHTIGELYDGRPYFEAKKEDYNQQFEVDGSITSSVDEYKLPYENNQSNFGIGYEYHIVDEENILVKIENLWIRYEYVDSDNKIK